MAPVEPILVFFGIERSHKDYDNDCDISQIVMKCGSSSFNKYVDPTMEISKEMTKINHLEIHNGKIYKDKVMKRSQPLNVVLEQLYQYLKKLNGPCTLIAHKCYFSSAVPLLRAIRDLAMEKRFGSVIAGFTDTFDMFKTKFPDQDPQKLNIHAMAIDINLRAQQSFNCGRSIKDNAKILEKLALFHFTPQELKAKRSFYSQLKRIEKFTAKMCQTASCPVVVDFFVVEKVRAERPLNKKKALKKQAKKGIEKIEKHADPCEAQEESENSENSDASSENMHLEMFVEDLSLIRDDEPIVIDGKSAKGRYRKQAKKGKKNTENNNDQCEIEIKSENSENADASSENILPEKAAEDVSLIRDDEPNVIDGKSAKDRYRKQAKKGAKKTENNHDQCEIEIKLENSENFGASSETMPPEKEDRKCTKDHSRKNTKKGKGKKSKKERDSLEEC